MKSENKFILELCKFLNTNKNTLSFLMEQPLDYPYILGQLLYNRVGAIAYHTLLNTELLHKTNREFINTLKSIYYNNAEKTNSFKTALSSMACFGAACKCPYAFLKGAYLVNLYPIGLRTSNDIDILIHPQDVTELSSFLKALNFRQGKIRSDVFIPATRREIIYSRINRGETVPFIKEISLPHMQFLEVDVNFSLGCSAGIDNNVVKELLSQIQPFSKEGLKTLSNVDFLIHLCAHLYKEATVMKWVEMGRDLSLYKFCDIYLFINQFLNKDFCETITQRINSLGLQCECYYALYYTKQLFDLESQQLEKLLKDIKPANTDFMKQVIDPQSGKTFCFDMDYTDWVFNSHRKDKLHEVKYG